MENFKEVIKFRLEERNRKESLISVNIIQDYGFLLNRYYGVFKQLEELRYENEKLKSRTFTGSGFQKICDLQEELTTTVKEKSALNTEVYELKLARNNKEKELLELQLVERSLRDQIARLEELNRRNGDSVKMLEDVKRTLQDEITANQMAYRTLETKFRVMEDANFALKENVRKSQEALESKKNEEFDRKFKMQQDAIKKSLQEAAGTVVDININQRVPLISVGSVPSRVSQRIDANDGEMGAVRFSSSGQWLATSGSDRKIKIWSHNLGIAESRATLTGCNGSVIAVDFDGAESLILGCSTLDSSCRIWSMNDFRMRLSLTGHSNKVVAGRFVVPSDPNRVVTGSADRTLKLWDCRTRCCTKTMLAMSAVHDLVVVSALGGLVVSGHFDKKLRLWDSRIGDLNTDQMMLNGRIVGMDLVNSGSGSAHDTQLLVATKDDCLQTVELRMLQMLQTYTAPHFKPGSDLVRPCFSPDGQYTVCGSQDGSIYVWSARTGKLEKTLKDHGSSIVAVHWSPSSNVLVSCERNKRVVLWAE